jgi:FkbM family methyltransferase
MMKIETHDLENTELLEPFGHFSPTPFQSTLIALSRRNRFARAAIRTRTNRFMQWLRPGPIDSSLFGWKFRFFPHQNTGDRKALLNPGAFDPKEIGLISKHLPLNGCFLDIGANIGVYSFGVLAQRPDAVIFAFEPSPKVFRKLAFNIDLNKLEGKIKALPLALSDKTGDIDFNSEHESLKLKSTSVITVKTDTLLNVLRSHRVDVIDALKIDV